MTPGANVDCHEAFELLYEYLDGELDAATEAAIKNHLEKCARCFSVFDFEKSYLLFLEARTRGRGAPLSVRKRILDSLLREDGPGPPSDEGA